MRIPWREAALFIFKNFATPMVFYGTFLRFGAKPAIAAAIGISVLVMAVHYFNRWSISPFFLIASGFTVALGAVDLCLDNPRYFRLEPFAQNFVLGGLFAVSAHFEAPLLKELIAALPAPFRPQLTHGDEVYLRRVTQVWGAYFFLKAVVFLYIGLKVDLGRLMILRTVIGGSSFVLVVAGEIAYRKWMRRPPSAGLSEKGEQGRVANRR